MFVGAVQRYLPAGSRILDMGCGTGAILSLLTPTYQCLGADPSELALEYCRKRGIAAIPGGFGKPFPFPPASFDGCLVFDVICHEGVADDVQALTEAASMLKPGGFLFIQEPAYEWMRSIHDAKAHGARRYTVRRLRDLLSGAGFEIVRVSYRVSLLFPLAILQRKILKPKDSDMREVNPILNRILFWIATLENWLLRYVDFPFGLSVFAVARKR